MFFKRTALTVCLWFVSCGLCAFDLQYGSFFTIQNIVLEQGRPVLPLARGKYANTRVLDKDTFSFLKTCTGSCQQEASAAQPELLDIRAALTRPGMWIADVSFDGKWLITFLIFENQTGYSVKEPEHFIFLDEPLKTQVHQLLASAAGRMKAAAKQASENL